MLIFVVLKIPFLTYTIPFAVLASSSYCVEFELPNIKSTIAPYNSAVAVHLAVQDLTLVHVLAEQDSADAQLSLRVGLHLTRVLVIRRSGARVHYLLFYWKACIEAYFAIVDQ